MQEVEIKEVQVKIEVIQALGQYLVSKPYAEVAELIQALQLSVQKTQEALREKAAEKQ